MSCSVVPRSARYPRRSRRYDGAGLLDRVQLQQASRDHDSLDFVSALGDGHQRGIAVEALGPAAPWCSRRRHGRASTRGCTRAPLRSRTAWPCRRRGRSAGLLSFLRAASRVSRRAARILVAISASLSWIAWCCAIGTTHRLPTLGVDNCLVEGGLGDAGRPRGDVDSADLESRDHLLKSAAFAAAEQVAGRDACVFEEEFRRLGTLVAELVDCSSDRESRCALLHQESGDAAVTRLGRGVGLGHRQVDVAAVAVGDEQFVAVEDVVVAVLRRSGTNGLGVGAGVGLGDCETAPASRPWRGRGRKRSFCSWVPCSSMIQPSITLVLMMPARPIQPRAKSPRSRPSKSRTRARVLRATRGR